MGHANERQQTGSRRNVLCIFCNHRRPKADEDIIPHWLANALDPTGAITTEFITAMPGDPIIRRERKSESLATLKLRRVCEVCNTGWMSDLEELTKPLLLPLIEGDSSKLSAATQRQITAWCQLKALSLDCYYSGTFRGFQHLPTRTAQEFGKEYQPLQASIVNLGRYVPPNAGVMLLWARYITSTPATDKTPALDIVVATFGFGHLFIQVSIGAWREPCNEHPTYSLVSPTLPQCWPPRIASLSWPPEMKIGAADFGAVAQPSAIAGASFG